MAAAELRTSLISSLGPPKKKNETAMPTARNAASLTIDSTATARISPSWCSVASACRVPNRIAKIASRTVTMSEMSPKTKSTGGAPL